MDPLTVFPDEEITPSGLVSNQFLELKIKTFRSACNYVHKMPYGYNSDREDLMILFKEGKGSCTTKHAVIATLGDEIGLSVRKHIGIYAMNEMLVTGTDAILNQYDLPYLPMVHCFLSDQSHRVDLTEGNANGKNGPIDDFLYSLEVESNISGKDEYMLYRNALKNDILQRVELMGIPIKTILQAREQGLALLKSLVN